MKAIKKKIILTNETFFYFLWTVFSLAFFLLTNSEIAYTYQVAELYKVISMIVILAQICAILIIKKWKISWLILCLSVIVLVFLGGAFASERIMLLVGALFAVLSHTISIDKLVKFDIKLKLCIFALIVSLCATGIIGNYTGNYYSGEKAAIGFAHPNSFTLFVITMLLEWLCICYKKMKWYDWLGIMVTWIAIMCISAARASGFTFVLTFMIFVLDNAFPTLLYTKISKIAFTAITPFITAISFLLSWLYIKGNSYIIALDIVLSSRIRLGALALEKYGIKVMGQDIEYRGRIIAINDTSAVIDNAYIRFSIAWGGLLFILIILAYSLLILKLLKCKRADLALFAMFFTLLGFGERNTFYIIFNLPLLWIIGIPKDISSNLSDRITRTYHNRQKIRIRLTT